MNRAKNIPYRSLLVAVCCFCAAFASPASAQQLNANQVLVIYNKEVADSKKLAELYQTERKIPKELVLGLSFSTEQDITRSEYETTFVKPLREHFDKQNWWKRDKDKNGVLCATKNRIRAIVLMRGVPLRIKASPAEATPPNTDPNLITANGDQASVDSELVLLGVNLPSHKGATPNSFFDSPRPLAFANMPHLMLVNRIDASSYDVCARMITDAVQTEKHGLWGRAYVDVANKFPQGDEWLENLISQNIKNAIPTVTDRFNETLPKNYPMTDAAIYYGWYNRNVDGPFLNPNFKFRPGAIAFHIHSFSAEQLKDPNLNWCAPLLARGAAATVGNVNEPFLHQTHYFHILHDRLLNGWTFAEAAAASIPVSSWQGIALGDPLYRPFLHFNGTGEVRKEDRDFRILRAAMREWNKDEKLRFEKLAHAQSTLPSGIIAEALAGEYLAKKDITKAQDWFNKARDTYTDAPDKLRQELRLVVIERLHKRNLQAITLLKNAQKTYGDIPEAAALSSWLEILDKPTN